MFPPSPGAWLLLVEIVGLGAIAAAGLWMWRQDRWKVFGLSILSFFILLAPTSSIVPSADAAFEHRLYLPMLAFAVFAASLLAILPRRSVLIVPVLALFVVLTIQRANVWASDVTLWEDTVKKAPGKARAWFNLGGAQMKVNPEQARLAFNRALSLEPFFPAVYYNLGVIEQEQANFSQAITFYQKAIEQDETYWPAWNNIGNTLVTLGQRERAILSFENVLRLNPDYWPVQYNIAILHVQGSRFELAIPKLRIVLDWRPDFKDARNLLGVCLSKMGKQAEAEQEWKQVRETAGRGYVPGQGVLSPPR
jgi:Flp pilus assembly protein TadD